MCYRLFIASDQPLPLVRSPTPTPVFDTGAVRPDERAGLPFDPAWCVVEAGSTSGCACDFHHAAASNRQHLADYLRPLAGRQALRLFSPWSGHEAEAPHVLPDLTVDDLLSDADPIPEQSLTSIIG